MWLTVAVVIVLALAACIAAAAIYGAFRWEAETRDLRTRLEVARVPIQPRVFHVRELEALPAPVERHFRIALKEGQPLVAAVAA